MELNKEFVEEWIEALLSDKYRQGRKFLRSKADEFCCLGVACNLVDNTRWIDKGNNDVYFYQSNSETRCGCLTGSMMEKIGLFTEEDYKIHDHLIAMNDEGKTFKEIAQYLRTLIEAKPREQSDRDEQE